jgi:hypothetical protein
MSDVRVHWGVEWWRWTSGITRLELVPVPFINISWLGFSLRLSRSPSSSPRSFMYFRNYKWDIYDRFVKCWTENCFNVHPIQLFVGRISAWKGRYGIPITVSFMTRMVLLLCNARILYMWNHAAWRGGVIALPLDIMMIANGDDGEGCCKCTSSLSNDNNLSTSHHSDREWGQILTVAITRSNNPSTFPNDIYKSVDVIFAAKEITFSFCNPMIIHDQPLSTITGLLPPGQTCLGKSRFPEFTDGLRPCSRPDCIVDASPIVSVPAKEMNGGWGGTESKFLFLPHRL